MKTLRLESDGLVFDFDLARRLADRVAREVLGDSICLSWYDRRRDQAAPSNVDECHDQCEVPGWEEYALSRGAELKVSVGAEDYLFCFRPAGEFAGL